VRILIIDDDKNICATFTVALEAMKHQIMTAANGDLAVDALRNNGFEAVFLDLRLSHESGLDLLDEILNISPRVAVIFVTAFASIETSVAAIKRGAFDYLQKPCTPEQLRQVIDRVQQARKLETRVAELESDFTPSSLDYLLRSESPQMQTAFEIAFKAAASDATILLLGESGTGKSVLAKTIHRRSPRADGPFVSVTCPSHSRELLESELFGHAKGAFPGAIAEKCGKVMAAEGGTLLLDEIGELSLDIQAKLLRLLHAREYERVGEANPNKANVRLIAATNRNLKQAVEAGQFRDDLYHRLSLITVMLPPLRERMSDFARLVHVHLNYLARQSGKEAIFLSRDALHQMEKYQWPGNLRELRNVLERSVILSSDDHIQSIAFSECASKRTEIRIGSNITLSELENLHIKRVMENSQTLDEAARVLGIDPATLYRKRKKRT
jgi:NtrC-family two-component system response regulator AlgB